MFLIRKCITEIKFGKVVTMETKWCGWGGGKLKNYILVSLNHIIYLKPPISQRPVVR